MVGPLESGQGYVVFLVEKLVGSNVLPYEKAKDKIRQQLEIKAQTDAEADLYEQLRARAHLEIRLWTRVLSGVAPRMGGEPGRVWQGTPPGRAPMRRSPSWIASNHERS